MEASGTKEDFVRRNKKEVEVVDAKTAGGKSRNRNRPVATSVFALTVKTAN
jgi:hypothetical protein